MNCGVGCRCSSDPALLWQWCRPAATALVRSLAWESPYDVGRALEKAKRQKKKKAQITVFLKLLKFRFTLTKKHILYQTSLHKVLICNSKPPFQVFSPPLQILKLRTEKIRRLTQGHAPNLNKNNSKGVPAVAGWLRIRLKGSSRWGSAVNKSNWHP